MADEVGTEDAGGNIVTPRLVQREVRDFQRAHELRRRQLPRSLLVGLFAGLVAVAFRAALAEADRLRDWLLVYVRAHPFWALPLPLVLGAVGAGAAVYVVRRFAPEAAGSGIPHVKAVLIGMKTMVWRRMLAVKFFGRRHRHRCRPGAGARGADHSDGRRGRADGRWLVFLYGARTAHIDRRRRRSGSGSGIQCAAGGARLRAGGGAARLFSWGLHRNLDRIGGCRHHDSVAARPITGFLCSDAVDSAPHPSARSPSCSV